MKRKKKKPFQMQLEPKVMAEMEREQLKDMTGETSAYKEALEIQNQVAPTVVHLRAHGCSDGRVEMILLMALALVHSKSEDDYHQRTCRIIEQSRTDQSRPSCSIRALPSNSSVSAGRAEAC